MSNWKELYDKNHRPGKIELETYLPKQVMQYFEEFSKYLARNYGLQCAPAVYSSEYGWTFRMGRSAIYMIQNVIIKEDAFGVDQLVIKDDDSYHQLLSYADDLYKNGFQVLLETQAKQKSQNQAIRTKERREREKIELEAMQERIKKDRFNQYHWAQKLSRKKLIKLYHQDVMGICDEELADEVGCTLYARCLQGKDEREYIESGKLKCHNCGQLLEFRYGLMECACGHQYMYRDYMRSFRTNNMPSGSATHIFQEFLKEWESAIGYIDKMRLIDNLIHEFHINLVTGVKGRCVAINFMEGTKQQITDVILSLAYSDWNQNSKEAYLKNLGKN